jgi:chromosomal replication initiator protein
MFDLVTQKWDEILDFFKKEHDISDVSFNAWIKPLEIHSVDDGIVTLLVKDENIMTGYLQKKYYLPLKVSIQEVTGEALDVEFLHSNEIAAKKKPSDINNKKASLSIPDPVGNSRRVDANLNPNYTFDNFVVGGNNNYAHAYALAVAESPAEMYNPLFIYGGVGLGKTHLMHSIGNFILDKTPTSKIRCVTSETFTNELINAIRSENQSAIVDFRDKYRNIDVLLIDDIQFIIGKERSQEEFFHTFNTLKEANKQIVISSDKPPKEITTLEERLKSRFEMGLTVDISAPDYETRMAILLKKAESEGYNIDNEIFQYIANNIKSNIRELEGALTKIVAFSRVSKTPIDIDFAKNVLKDIISPDENKEITTELIINIVAEHYNISPTDICSKKKSQDIVYPRQIAMYLCRLLTETSLQVIGTSLGKRDHTTVMHAIEKIQNEIETNESTKNTIDIIKKKIIPS